MAHLCAGYRPRKYIIQYCFLLCHLASAFTYPPEARTRPRSTQSLERDCEIRKRLQEGQGLANFSFWACVYAIKLFACAENARPTYIRCPISLPSQSTLQQSRVRLVVASYSFAHIIMSGNRKLYEFKITLNHRVEDRNEEVASVTHKAFIEGTSNGTKEVAVPGNETGLAHRQCSNKDLFDANFAEMWERRVCRFHFALFANAEHLFSSS